MIYYSLDCIRSGLNYGVTTITGPSHASYYPGSNPISLKIVYDNNTGKLLGGQATGGLKGVDKRLDVLATALAGGMTVEDLAHLDLSYAPPFGSARDVINTAGFSGLNKRIGMLNTVSDLTQVDKDNSTVVIDVRDSTSATVKPIPTEKLGGCKAENVINIPLEVIRGRIQEIQNLSESGKKIITVCNLGKLSYFASRILSGYDIPAQSLSGGLEMLKTKPFHVLEEPVSCRPVNKEHQSSNPVSPLVKGSNNSTQQTFPLIHVDVCGISCPGPIMAIKKELPRLNPGQLMKITASDPGFFNDFKAFCRVNNLIIDACTKEGGIITGILRKPGDNPVVESKVDKTMLKDTKDVGS